MDTMKMEVLLRLLVILLFLITACLVGFDTQTKTIFSAFTRKATFRDLDSLFILVFIESAAGAYNVLQLVKCLVSFRFKGERNGSYKNTAWVCFFLDQAVVYITFGANTAALGGSMLAVTGANSFAWTKLCNLYTRFCVQIGGALLCGYFASIFMAILSSIFSVDGTPIIEFKNAESLGVPFPKKQPMRIYSSLWNADDWATQGGRVKTDWNGAPFVASYRNFSADACIWSHGSSSCNSTSNSTANSWLTEGLGSAGLQKLKWVQKNHMIYNYCKDTQRFPQGPALECKLL